MQRAHARGRGVVSAVSCGASDDGFNGRDFDDRAAETVDARFPLQRPLMSQTCLPNAVPSGWHTVRSSFPPGSLRVCIWAEWRAVSRRGFPFIIRAVAPPRVRGRGGRGLTPSIQCSRHWRR